MRRKQPVTPQAVKLWRLPEGWTSRQGVIAPADYAPSPFELLPPPILTTQDALREYARCSAPGGLAYFATRYCWTLHVDDPGGAPTIRRLPAYPYMRDLLADIDTPQNLLIDKARQMLTSWAHMTAYLRDLLFRPDWPMWVMSRRAKEVDDGGENSTPDSLLGKLRFMYERLPPFLWRPLEIQYNRISNRQTGTYVRGETGAGSGAARGPAAKRALMDEAAFIPRSESAFAGARQSCKTGLVLNSSPLGMANAFARIRHSKTARFKKVSLHWTLHPEKAAGLGCSCGWQASRTDVLPSVQLAAHRPVCPRREGPEFTSPWYRAQQADLTEEQVASELDMSYERSARGRVYAFDSARHTFDAEATIDPRTGKPVGPPRDGETKSQWTRRYLAAAIDPRKEVVVAWDFGVSDETAVVLGQIEDEGSMRVRWLAELLAAGKDWTFYHQHVVAVWYVAYARALGYTLAQLEAWAKLEHIGLANRPAPVPDFHEELPPGALSVYHAGDPTGRNRDSSLSSWIANLAGADPSVHVRYLPFGPDSAKKYGSQLDWVERTRTLVRRDAVMVSTACPRLIDGFNGWKWPTDADGQVVSGRVLPVHDLHSHPMTAQLYLYRTRWRGRVRDVVAGGESHERQIASLIAEGRTERRRDTVEEDEDT